MESMRKLHHARLAKIANNDPVMAENKLIDQNKITD
jgi:hypothetical protein